MRSESTQRTGELPEEISPLLDGADPATLEGSWSAFADRYSPLILHTAGKVFRDRDGRMDAYTYVLEQLRADGFGRLKSFSRDGRSSFTTWLVVVCQRLCLDMYRRRYGRARETKDGEGGSRRDVRRRLVDLVAEELEPHHKLADDSLAPDQLVRREELRSRVDSALAALAPRDRLLLVRRFYDDESVKEIASAMRFDSVFQVYRHLKRILLELREHLEAAGVDGPES